MAFEYMAWAMKQKIGHSPTKFVLFAICNYADESGQCFPSAATIKRITEQSEKTIYRALETLEEMGVIKRVRKRRKDGSLGTYQYQILTSGLSDSKTQSLVDCESSRPVDCESTHNQSVLNQSVKKTKGKKKSDNSAFEIFWKNYPRQRRGSRAKALTAFNAAIAREPPDKILRGLQAYAQSKEVADGYAKGAAAWLNDDRWTTDYRRKKDEKPTTATVAEKVLEELRAERGADSLSGGAMLCDARQLRQDPIPVGDFDEGNGGRFIPVRH